MPALRRYGSKLRPYGSRQPDPLATIHADIKRLLAEQRTLEAEEERLFKIVDKADLNGRRDSNRAYEARVEWNKVWRRLERHNSTLHNTLARERSIRNGKI